MPPSKRVDRKAAPKSRASTRESAKARDDASQAGAKSPKTIRNAHAIYSEHELGALTLEQDIARNNALHVLSLMRVQGWSLTRSAREVGLTREAARAWVGQSIGKRQGRYVARPADKLVRKMAVLTPRGSIWVPIYDSRVASKLGAYHAAVKAALSGHPKALAPFRGKLFRTGGKRGFPFITSLNVLRRLAEADVLPEYQIYEPSTR